MDKRLVEAVKSGALSHAYLLADEEDARRLSAIILCQSLQGCGVCRSCALLAEGAHPDLIELSGANAKDANLKNASIKVEAVRGMIAAASLSAHYSRRVVLITGCHEMTAAAQNALLKTLEEAPDGVHFILSGNENGMLPTVLSRCQVVRAGGYTGQSEPTQEVVKAACALFTDPLGQMEYYAKHKDLLGVLGQQAEFFADCARFKRGVPVRYKSNEPSARECAKYDGAQVLAQLCLDTQLRLRGNANARLAAGRMLATVWKLQKRVH